MKENVRETTQRKIERVTKRYRYTNVKSDWKIRVRDSVKGRERCMMN